MEQIRKYFEKTFRLSDQDWHIFSSKLIKKEFPKKHILLKAGQVENHLSFIETGIVRFYIPKEENDLTFSFTFNNSFVSGYDSFLTQTPSTYNVETLTKTTLWQLTYSNLQVIYHETEIGNAIGRQASEELFLKKSKRELSLLNQTAEQRYLNLFTEQPELLKQIPLKYIASYIGITPQALSRIRKRISKPGFIVLPGATNELCRKKMKPLIVLLIVFAVSLFVTKTLRGSYNFALSGRIAMSAMLVFSAIAHFAFTKGMSLMIPEFIPFKTATVYLTGVIEIVLAIGLLFPNYRVLSAWLVIAFLILILPANIYAALKQVDYQKATFNGNGLPYLWFRIPLQILFIIWTYLSGIKGNG